MDSKLRIIIDALGGDAKAEIGQIAKDLKGMGTALDQSSAQTKRAGLSVTDLNAGVQLLQQGYGQLKQGLDATVGATVAYAERVRDLSRAMGASAEDASVLIQAGDDLNISFESLEQASKKLNQEGIQPSIANLSAMADEYLGITDPVKRAQFAIDKFGLRAGPEMQKLLEKGSAGLEEMAAAAREAGQVLSRETVVAARELELAQDDLNDAMEGAALIIGTELLPVITDLTLAAGKAAPSVKVLAEGFVDAWEAGEQLWKIQKLLLLELAAWVTGADQQAKILAAQMILNDGLTDAQLREAAATEAQRKHWEQVADFYRSQAEPATEDLADDVARLKQLQSDLSAAIAGPIQESWDTYYEQQRDAGAAIVETQDRIKELNALPHLTDAQRAELDELLLRLDEQKQAYEDNAKKHEETTARIVFGMLTQRLAVDGLSDEEYDFLTDIGEAWGIYDTKTVAALRAVDVAIAEHGLNAGLVLDDLQGKIDGLPDSKIIYIDTIHRTYYETYGAEPGPEAPVIIAPGELEPGGPDSFSEPDPPSVPGHGNTPARALGGPVYAAHPYWVGEYGKEPFFPAVDGRIISHADAMAALSGAWATPLLSESSAGSVLGNVNGDTYHFHFTIDARGSTMTPDEFERLARKVTTEELDRMGHRADGHIRMGTGY